MSYSYDKVGNRLKKAESSAQGTVTVDYIYDVDDRLTQETKVVNGGAPQVTAYAWDARGRLAKKLEPGLATLYRWDGQDRLLEVKQGPAEATAQAKAQYAYDADGNRIQKVEKGAQGDKVTDYLVDATFPYAQVVEETVTQEKPGSE